MMFKCMSCKNQNTSICVYECHNFSRYEEMDCSFACRYCEKYPCSVIEEENSQG